MDRKESIINKFEKAGLVTVVVIWLLRAVFGPAFNFALLVTTTVLSVYYLWFGFFIFTKLRPWDLIHRHIRQSINRFAVITGILMGVIISHTLIAILFGFYFFPGTQAVISVAAVALLLFTGFLIIIKIIDKKSRPHCNRYYLRAGILGVFLLLLWLLPLETKLEILYKDYPEFRAAYIEYVNNPECEQAIHKLREERSRFR
ncbi:MAG: hypothetical protein EA394_03405 [Bacteroidia bacterium]|nr:MAG: hypothetical protein EA394_03405 [Bacteroidia bacterium]